MKRGFVFAICLVVFLTFVGQAQARPPESNKVVEGYAKLPLAFELNQGQTDPQVKFLSKGAGYSLFLTADAAVLALQPPVSPPLARRGKSSDPQSARAVLRMKLVNANPNTKVSGLDELPGKSNYFIGNDPQKWHTNLRQFSKVRYQNIYPGVDLLYYGHQRELEYDFVLQPGVRPHAIRLGIAGARRLRLEHGDLVLTTPAGDVRLRSPHIYQETSGARHQVRGRYVIRANGEVGFEVAAYDHRRELVIDPVLAYATYLGGSSTDHFHSIAVDSVGNAYVTGDTASIDFPTANAIQPTIAGGELDAFVTKFNRDGTALIYSTFLGGSLLDTIYGIAVDSSGSAYVAGWTFSPDFPTRNAFQSASGGNADTFVTKINATGSALVYSTYLGGSDADFGRGIAVDSFGNAYVAGFTYSVDFPTKNAFQSANAGIPDAFVTKVSPSGSTLVYSTYLGGTGEEQCSGIAVNSAGNAYITGATTSTDFPTKNAIQPTNGGGFDDAFVTKIASGGNALIYSSYLGGNGTDAANAIAVDSTGDAYVVGLTNSFDFPTANAIQSTNHGGTDAFVTKINPLGSAFVYSTYLGGPANDSGTSIAVDSAGSAYIIGSTKSQFPKTPVAFQQTLATLNHGFVAKIAQQTFVSVSAANLYFGGGVIGTTSPAKVVTVSNRGSSTITIKRIYIGGLDPGDFAEINTCGSALASGATCRVTVTFTPTAKNSRQAGLGISTPDPASPQAVGLHGSGTVVSLSQQSLSFGDQKVGTTVARSITLTNTGSTPLNFTGITITGTNAGDFSQTNTCGTGIAATASCAITIKFKPTATGIRKASLGISDDGGGSPQKMYLAGTGT